MALHFYSAILGHFDTLLKPTSFLSLGAVLVLYWASCRVSSSGLRELPYPPGPPPKDFISGNARDLSSTQLWFTFADWATTYGRIVHLKAFNKHMIVINSVEDAVELMEKRSNNYSDRPFIPMIKLMGWTFTTPFKGHGPEWHNHRRLFQQTFKPSASLNFRPTQIDKAKDFLCSLLDNPDKFMDHIKTLSAAIIMSTMYGYNVAPKDDYFTELAEHALYALSQSTFPGAAVVNTLPFLKVLPPWFPGAGFQRFALKSKDMVERMQQVPYKYVQTNLVGLLSNAGDRADLAGAPHIKAAGTASPSLVAALIDTCKSEEDHHLLQEVAATGYAAGSETTTSALESFFYAMTIYPHVQRKAQEELDRVIGNDRLVAYEDQPSLPYIQALMREVFRWRPVLPLSIFHVSREDDVYNGYYIPKGATIVPNIWGMTRDSNKYKDPEEFNPDRFFDENNQLNNDDVNYTFGFGRRLCPGRHMASATVWFAMAAVLSTYDIQAPKDESGKDIPLDIKYTGGLVNHPLPFKCIITPRSKQLILNLKNNLDV